MKTKLRIIAATLMLMLLPTCAYAYEGDLVTLPSFCTLSSLTYNNYTYMDDDLFSCEPRITRVDTGGYTVYLEEDITLMADENLNIIMAFMGVPTSDLKATADDNEDMQGQPSHGFFKTTCFMIPLEFKSVANSLFIEDLSPEKIQEAVFTVNDLMRNEINRIANDEVVFAYDGNYYSYFLRTYGPDLSKPDPSNHYDGKVYIMAVPHEDTVRTEAPAQQDIAVNEQ